MDKQQIIDFIKTQLAAGKIGKEDLAMILGNDSATPVQDQNNSVVADSANVVSSSQSGVVEEESSSRNITNILYVIGGTIVLAGIAILIVQNWNEIGTVGRIMSTLGISLITYVFALLIRSSEHRILSSIMFIISAILSQPGIFILLSEMKIDFSNSIQIYVLIALSIIYSFALWLSRRGILVIIVAAFTTWLYYLLIDRIFGLDAYLDFDIFKWATIVVGIVYILIGYGIPAILKSSSVQETKENNSVRGLLYGAGTLAILGVNITFGGIFDFILIILIFAAFYGGAFLKSRLMLIIAAGFLIAHIIKLTSRYFLDSIGWPVSLIIVGFLVIGIAYFTYYLSKKYISGRNS